MTVKEYITEKRLSWLVGFIAAVLAVVGRADSKYQTKEAARDQHASIQRELDDDRTEMGRRLERIEDKIDRLIERRR